MDLPPFYLALLLWETPVFEAITSDGTEIRCWEYEGKDYQLTIEASRDSLYSNEPPTVIANDESQFCESICH